MGFYASLEVVQGFLIVCSGGNAEERAESEMADSLREKRQRIAEIS